jgi:hypothetical protein
MRFEVFRAKWLPPLVQEDLRESDPCAGLGLALLAAAALLIIYVMLGVFIWHRVHG